MNLVRCRGSFAFLRGFVRSRESSICNREITPVPRVSRSDREIMDKFHISSPSFQDLLFESASQRSVCAIESIPSSRDMHRGHHRGRIQHPKYGSGYFYRQSGNNVKLSIEVERSLRLRAYHMHKIVESHCFRKKIFK